MLGRNLFGDIEIDSDEYDENMIRFDTFFTSLIQCFLVSTGEHWTDIMYYTMAHSGARASIFFVVLVLISKLVLVYLTQAALLASVLTRSISGQSAGAYVIQSIYDKHARRIGFERFRWNTVVGIVEKMALTSWCRAALVCGGSTRLLNLAQVLGLRGEILKSARLQLTHYDGADNAEVWEDTKLEAKERDKLQIPLPVWPKAPNAVDIRATVALFEKRDKPLDLPASSGIPADILESRCDWINQARIAILVAQFALEHVPFEYILVCDEHSRDFCLTNKETGFQEILTHLEKEAVSETTKFITAYGDATSTQVYKPNLFSKSVFDIFLRANQETRDYGDNNKHDIVLANIRDAQYCDSTRFGPWFRFQHLSRALTSTRVWSYLVVFMIVASCVLVLIRPENTADLSLYSILEYICIIFFFVEVLLMIGRGSKSHQGYSGLFQAIQLYFKDGWNCLDFVIFVGNALSPLARNFNFASAYSMCRIINGFRPLRLINRVQRLKETVRILLNSIRSLLTLGLFVLYALSAWAIIGMQLLSGYYNDCDDSVWAEDAEYEATVGAFPADSPANGVMDANGTFAARSCFGNYTNAAGDRLEAKGEWVSAAFNFDYFPNSLVSTFTFVLGGWGDTFLQGLLVTSVDHSPNDFHHDDGVHRLNFTFFYFLLGVVFFNIYIPNESLAVMFNSYSVQKVKQSPVHSSVQEKKILMVKQRINRLNLVRKPKFPIAEWRQVVRRITGSTSIVNFIFATIVINAVALATEYHGQAHSHRLLVDWIEVVLAAIFILEAVLKIVGSGFSAYFFQTSNLFDFGISVVSSLDSILIVMGRCHESDSMLVRILRSMRILRMVRILRMLRGFEVVTLVISCVSAYITSVAELLLILIFIFSNIGVALFGHFSNTGSRYANFENELSSMQLLFVLMTGEAWTDFMETMVQSNEDSYLRIVSTFVIFLTLSKLILENLFVMVCLFAVMSNLMNSGMNSAWFQYTSGTK